MSNNLLIYPDGRLDTDNASKYLGVAKKTLAQWRSDSNRGPQYIKRGRIFYFKKDLDSWLLEHGKFINTAQSNYANRKGQHHE